MGWGLGKGWLEIAPDDGKRNEMEMNVAWESRRPNGMGSGEGLARDRAG